MNTKKSTLSHNVYSDKEQFRLRLYRNDHKFYEKQITLKKYHDNSFSNWILFILEHFLYKIAEESGKKDRIALENEKFLSSLNQAYMFSYLMQSLRGDNND